MIMKTTLSLIVCSILGERLALMISGLGICVRVLETEITVDIWFILSEKKYF